MDMIIGRCSRYAAVIFRATSITRLSIAHTRCLCHCDARSRNLNNYDTNLRWRNIGVLQPSFLSSKIDSRHYFPNYAFYSTDTSQRPDKDCYEPPPSEKQSIFQRMKQMTKDYWHILIPVHVVTSIGWIAIFYTAAKNGVDIVSILESLNMSERYLDMLRGSNAGHWAVAYALYKLFTPIRYTVTVGGTTMSIRWLNKWGYLKFKPRSTIKETQSSECATKHREKYAKTGFKDEQQTEPPKT